MCSRRLTRRPAWILGILGGLVAAGGLASFIYGLQTMPAKLPEYPLAPVVYPQGQAEKLNQYRIQSDGFKYAMAGLAGMVFPVLVAIVINCCCETIGAPRLGQTLPL